MNRYTSMLAIIAMATLLPSVSQANCSAKGGVPGVYVQKGAVATNVGVRTNRIGPLFNFSTTDSKLINTALAAATTNTTVLVAGDAPVCPPVNAQGYIEGGSILAILVNPD
jgi:low affinity Fe/Cu permease